MLSTNILAAIAAAFASSTANPLPTTDSTLVARQDDTSFANTTNVAAWCRYGILDSLESVEELWDGDG